MLFTMQCIQKLKMCVYPIIFENIPYVIVWLLLFFFITYLKTFPSQLAFRNLNLKISVRIQEQVLIQQIKTF